MKRLGTRLLLLAVMFVAGSCGSLTPSDANKRFLERNPTYSIIRSFPEEGDGVAVYYKFIYRKPGESRVRQDKWLFMKNEKSDWEVRDIAEEAER